MTYSPRLKDTYRDEIAPKLKDKFVKGHIYHQMIRTGGIPESKLAEKLTDWEKNLPDHIKLGGSYRPKRHTKPYAHFQGEMFSRPVA